MEAVDQMDLGVFMMPLHPPEKPTAQGFDEDLELICRADELGYREAWVGEHMTSRWETIAAPDLFLAKAFALTRNIRLGTGVYLPALHHPAELATRAAMLDQLSRGRFNLGMGTGSIPADRPFMGVDGSPEAMQERFVEGFEVILKLFSATPPWRHEGKHWTVELTGAQVDLDMGFPIRPYTLPHPPIGIPGYSPNSGSMRMAGRRGYWALSTNLAANWILGTHWDAYRAGLAEGGHPIDPAGWRVAREVFVADTDEEAFAYAIDGPMGRNFRRFMMPLLVRNTPDGLGTFKDDPEMPDSAVTVEFLARNVWLVGSPETVVAKINRLRDSCGRFGVLLAMGHDWEDPDRAIHSLELLANEVRPNVG